MEKLSQLLVEDKLKLKSDKARKAEQTLNDILNRNMLTGIHTKCIEAAMRERQLLKSSEMEEVKRNLSAMKENLSNSKSGRKTSNRTRLLKNMHIKTRSKESQTQKKP